MRNLLASASLDFIYIGASAPDAPPLSDTTIGCFIRLFFCTAACSMRAIWSEAPPAPAATTISTGFDGSHAMADPAMETASSVPAQTRRLPDILDMALPFLTRRAATLVLSRLRRGVSIVGRAFCGFVPAVQANSQARRPRQIGWGEKFNHTARRSPPPGSSPAPGRHAGRRGRPHP